MSTERRSARTPPREVAKGSGHRPPRGTGSEARPHPNGQGPNDVRARDPSRGRGLGGVCFMPPTMPHWGWEMGGQQGDWGLKI